MTTWERAAVAVGGACGFVVLLSPSLLPSAGTDVITAGLLPLGFFAAGGIALVLRPGHAVGARLLAVGVLHLTAVVAAAAVALRPAPWLQVCLGWLSTVLFTLGFVALLDLLARFPSGSYAWAPLARAVRTVALLAVAVITLAFLGSRRAPSVLGLETGPNPVYVPALEPLAQAGSVVFLTPVLGVGLLLARYPGAPKLDRSQMRWPIVTAVLLAVGLVTTAWAETALGAQVQAAVFITAAAALPGSFLVGLLRHSEEADRLAALEASRTRLVEVADAERRRIERDLHDGAQQHLLALLARVELAHVKLGDGQDGVDRELEGISEGIRQVHRGLRDSPTASTRPCSPTGASARRSGRR